jgi:hypothetical protein
MSSRVQTRSRSPRLFASAGALTLAIAIVIAVMWSTKGANTTDTVVTTGPTVHSTAGSPLKGLTAPRSSVASDAQFLSDVTEVDPALGTYEKKSGNVALRSLLTDGSAFCAFLNRDDDLDTAMVSVVLGARHVEAQTHLPISVTTFNSVDSVALLTLCPSLQSTVPTRELVKIRKLGAELAVPSN